MQSLGIEFVYGLAFLEFVEIAVDGDRFLHLDRPCNINNVEHCLFDGVGAVMRLKTLIFNYVVVQQVVAVIQL